MKIPKGDRFNSKGRELLIQHMQKNSITPATMAEKAGLSLSQMSHLIWGRRNASFPVAFRIQDATKGKVPAREWLR